MKQLKNLSALIAMLLCSTCLFAHDFEVNGIYYKILNSTDRTVEVTYKSYFNVLYSDYSGNISISKNITYNGSTYRVTSIGYKAFYNCKGLTSVTIPNSVTSIGDYAFSGCYGLTSVHISDLEAWCKIKFGDSYSNPLEYAGHLYLNGEEIKDLVIPNSVTSIGRSAFKDCDGLTSVTIPNSVESIGDEAFEYCSGLTSVTIPNSVTSIGGSAFSCCSGLTSVTIPNSVTSIGKSAFSCCYGLTSVHISDLEAWCKIKFGDGYSNPLCSEGHLYLNGEEIKDLVIPNSVESIGRYAFYSCKGLTSVTIPNSVTSIGYYAFAGCFGLTSVHISDLEAWCKIKFGDSYSNPLYYAGHLYLNGEEIKDLVIPNSVTSIDYAFAGCSGLTSVTIPNSVTSIGESAFEYCSGLTSVTIPNSVTSIGGSAFSCCSGLTSVTIPNSVTSIGSNAFEYCSGLTSVTIPNSVTSIGDEAFYKCYGLTSVTIPNSVTSIGRSAFKDCDGLTSVTIPNSVESIGDEAFEYCSGLTSVTIPNSVTSIGGHAFYGCYGLTSVHISDLEAWCKIKFGDIHSNPLDYADHLYLNGEEIKDLVIPNSVTSIGESAFEGCSGLTSVTIPNSVTSIGGSAFSCCSGLTSVTIGNSVTSIGKYAFEGCSGLTSVTIGNSVTSIGKYAFEGCSGLTSVTIPNSVTSIGDRAFADCSGLKLVINLSDLNIISGSSGNGYVAYYADRVATGDFIDGDYVWAETDGEYTLASYLGNETNLVLPDGYNGKNYAIGEYAFLGCSGLRALTIGSGVKSIGEHAFEDCEKLEDVYAMSLTAVECNKNIFSQTVYDNGTLYVPGGSIASYEKTVPWNYFYIRPNPTAIEGVEMDAEDSDAPVYNLRGVRMQSTDNLPKGVYIRNGKKFVVK